jgi:hypothetical protein
MTMQATMFAAAAAVVVALLVAAATPSSALFCSTPGARAFYYNDTGKPFRVTNPVARTVIDPTPNLAESNIPNVGNNTFSAHWFSVITAPATGLFRFEFFADDGIRWWFNGIREPDQPGQWATRPATTFFSPGYNLIANKPYSFSPVFYQALNTFVLEIYLQQSFNNGVSYSRVPGLSYLACTDMGNSFLRTLPPAPTVAEYCNPEVNGLVREIIDENGNILASSVVDNVDFSVSTPPSPLPGTATAYTVRFRGVLEISQSDNWQLRVVYQDQFSLFINDNLVASETAPNSASASTFTTTQSYSLINGERYAFRIEGRKLASDTSPNFQVQFRWFRLGFDDFAIVPQSRFRTCTPSGIIAAERLDSYTASFSDVPVSLRRAPAGTVCLQLESLTAPGIQEVDVSPSNQFCFTPGNWDQPQVARIYPGGGVPHYSQVQFRVASTGDSTLYPVGMNHIYELTRATAALSNGMGGGTCSVFGLSRIISFDGSVYTASVFGDYFLTKFATGEISVQARLGPCGSASSFACVQGVAIRYYDQRITLVVVDNLPVIWTNFDSEGAGNIVIRLNHGRDYTFEFPDNFVVQVKPRDFGGSADTWGLQVFLFAPSAYTTTPQSFRGLCGTITSSTSDDFLTFAGVIAGSVSDFATAMQVPNAESLFVTGPSATSPSFASADPIPVTERAVNSPGYRTFPGDDATSSIAAYTALYVAPVSPQPVGVPSAPGGSTTCPTFSSSNIATLCANVGFNGFATLQTMCQQDSTTISAAQGSAAAYEALYETCLAFAAKAGQALDPNDDENLCPTLCFGQGTCVADNTCSCSLDFSLSDCSRQTNFGPFTAYIDPTSGVENTFVRAHGEYLYMAPSQTTLFCLWDNDVQTGTTSVTEFDVTCLAPGGKQGNVPFQIVRSGVTAEPSTATFAFPGPPEILFYGDRYTSPSCTATQIFVPVSTFKDCAIWTPDFIDAGKLVQNPDSTVYCCTRRGVFEFINSELTCVRKNCLQSDILATEDCTAVDGQIGEPCFQYCINLTPVVDQPGKKIEADSVPIYSGPFPTLPPGTSTLTPYTQRNVYLVLPDESLDVGWEVTTEGPSATNYGCRVYGELSADQLECNFGCANAATLAMTESCVIAPLNSCYCQCQEAGDGVFPAV